MKNILLPLVWMLIAISIYSCSSSDNNTEELTIPYYDKNLMGTWVSATPNDTIYATFNSFKYSISTPYFEQIIWKPAIGNSNNILDRWYYQWTSYRILKRYLYESEKFNKEEIVTYKISEKGDSLSLDNYVYTRLNGTILTPL